MPHIAREVFPATHYGIRMALVAVAIGLVGLEASCLNTDNPQGSEDVYMGYPLFSFIASRSLLISFPPIPLKVSVLWTGLAVDMLLYTSVGLIVSFMVVNLRENMRLLKFLVKSGAVFLLGSFLVLLFMGNPSPYQVVPPIFIAGQSAFLFSLAAAPIAAVLYGYYLLFKKRRNPQESR